MKNPFLSVSDIDQTEYLTPRVSLNRAVIAKLPLCGVEDEIEGKPFKDIFSTPLIVRDIRATLKRYGLSAEGIPDSELPKLVDEGLRSENARKRQMAEQIARRFGRRLGLLLLMLRTGERENRLARDDWDDACWEFWKQLDAVILTGGLASGMLGRRFKEYIHSIFDSAGVRCCAPSRFSPSSRKNVAFSVLLYLLRQTQVMSAPEARCSSKTFVSGTLMMRSLSASTT